ncbi:hypothetical protein LNV08_13255 [Paucibacter sp. TC2R-5]|uniref:hypothetical protein n=1 Tax=Paucibacter sp. TC2R-5 TaxID=2893555 RepID=UPI0021E46B2E|nr:hypothetical protein [Paucibacter sp. TC2R-5]MCV2359939.1 hypothetical protein [Paucibacter sp. TC2R-5]
MTTKSNFIPDDFPREQPPGSVSGVQAKILVRRVDGKYISGLTDEEIAERFDNCLDLVDQLYKYCSRKQTEQPNLSVETLLLSVRESITRKGWDVTPAELDWIMSKLADRINKRSRK